MRTGKSKTLRKVFIETSVFIRFLTDDDRQKAAEAERLFERIEKGEIDPSFVITHSAKLEDGPELYKTFRAKKDGCIKVVMKP